jgi:hypothetical protein
MKWIPASNESSPPGRPTYDEALLIAATPA